MMATFMAAMESSIVATAMPTIVAELGGFRLFSWAFAAYLLTQAVTIPIYGRLADLYGRKRVFYAGAGLFLFASALCGLAWAMLPLILFRALQGAGAGAIQPIATTIVGDIYKPTERARVQGYISGVFGVAAIIGPMLGAFLVEHVTWSLVFWINLPIGAVTFVMFGLFLHERQPPRRHRIDYLGSALMVLGVGGLMLALVEVGNSGGIGTILALAAGGAAALWVLAVHERGAAEPILPLRLWRDRVIAVGSLSGFTGGMVMMAINAFLPLYVQGAMGRGPAAAGLALGAASVSWTFASVAAGRLMIRTSYRLAATIGGISLIAGTLVLTSLGPASALAWAGFGSLLVGVGMGFCNTSFLVSTQARVDWNERGMATSSIMFMRIVGNSVGAAVFGAILNFGINRRIPGAGEAVNRLLEPAARQALGAAEITRLSEAVAGSLHVVYIVAGLVAVVSLLLALALPARLSPTRPHTR
ncbi:MAG: MFS transporter [Alphaproteobacteria bacterium]|nr:MFS transporter [Alphaproteobacteria bacterium]MBV9375078.1 MFS transporter [Alphaproteobacteria bacterium]